MTQHYLIGILMLTTSVLLEVSSLPTPSEITTTEEINTTPTIIEKERSLTYDETNTEHEDITKEILEKIQAINDALRKPDRRPQNKWNFPQQSNGGYIIDKEILEKLQEVIASGKLHQNSNAQKQQSIEKIDNDLEDNIRYSRRLQSGNQAFGTMPMAYMMNMPVLVMGNPNGYANMNQMENLKYQTKDGPTSPFGQFQWPSFGQFEWPLAPFFPILIRDPLLSVLNGGGWNNFIEAGQSADVCSKKHKVKSVNSIKEDEYDDENDLDKETKYVIYPIKEKRTRQKRALKKRTISHGTQLQKTDSSKKSQKFFLTKTTTTTAKPVKDTKSSIDEQGDLRFPFGDFTFFGNRKPVAPSPGFFINRLKVRRGGVAIAGPGGVATAGRGGTAIVGPGGLAYTQPGGLAVAGPAARIVALSSDADLNAIATRLQEQSQIDGSVSNLLQAIPEGKIVATGPIIYYHPNE